MNSTDMSGEELGNKLLQAVKEMQAGTKARKTLIEPNEVAKARIKTGLSQKQFATALQISPRTLQEWEQGRRKPSGAAKTLIHIAFRYPEIIQEELRANG
jgi:putative transcriptional regulator